MIEETIKIVKDVINETLIENGFESTSLNEKTNILGETNLDSIGLAVVIVKLEEITGKDPFVDGFVPFTTIYELGELYDK